MFESFLIWSVELIWFVELKATRDMNTAQCYWSIIQNNEAPFTHSFFAFSPLGNFSGSERMIENYSAVPYSSQ